MSIKLPKNFVRWLIIATICFVVGIVVSQLFLSTNSSVIVGDNSINGGGQSYPKSVVRKADPSFTGIFIALAVIVALVGYGYFREKRKNK